MYKYKICFFDAFCSKTTIPVAPSGLLCCDGCNMRSWT